MDDKAANIALKMGRVIGVAPLGNFPIVQSSLRLLDKALELAALSGRDLDFIHNELTRYPGTIDALKRFYLSHGCFPGERKEDV